MSQNFGALASMPYGSIVSQQAVYKLRGVDEYNSSSSRLERINHLQAHAGVSGHICDGNGGSTAFAFAFDLEFGSAQVLRRDGAQYMRRMLQNVAQTQFKFGTKEGTRTLPRRRRLKTQVLPLPQGPRNKTLSLVWASLSFFFGTASSLYDKSSAKSVTTAAMM